ncbi:MAG TPA: hypothetical protein VNX68_02400 [Nitrosopumilaceae archaeon]|jgi:hypothetical protein|nr:hypothetical protein [Nitrosopumilaceae archaeon]
MKVRKYHFYKISPIKIPTTSNPLGDMLRYDGAFIDASHKYPDIILIPSWYGITLKLTPKRWEKFGYKIHDFIAPVNIKPRNWITYIDINLQEVTLARCLNAKTWMELYLKS